MGEGKGGDEFEGACKRRHGDGSDLNFYLLLAHSSPLLPLSLSVALVACSLLCPPNQMKERRDASKREEKDEMERERECGSVFFFLFFCRVCFALPLPPFLHFVPRLAELLPQLSLPPSSCLDRSLVNNSMTTWRQRTGRNFY